MLYFIRGRREKRAIRMTAIRMMTVIAMSRDIHRCKNVSSFESPDVQIAAIDRVDQHELFVALYLFGSAVVVDDHPCRHERASSGSFGIRSIAQERMVLLTCNSAMPRLSSSVHA